jgi:hypothetical protein
MRHINEGRLHHVYQCASIRCDCATCPAHATPSVQSQQGSASHSFLLDDDSSNPFNANEVALAMNDKDLYSEMPMPEPLKDNKAFEFLQRDLKITAMAAQPAQ